jgi:Recombination endonuclease VII
MRIPEKREAMNEWRRQWKRRNLGVIPMMARKARLALYGMTEETYDAMVISQDGLCPICRREMIECHIDHDHDTGRVRKLLCGPCNRGLGQFRDDIPLMLAAIEYLKAHR